MRVEQARIARRQRQCRVVGLEPLHHHFDSFRLGHGPAPGRDHRRGEACRFLRPVTAAPSGVARSGRRSALAAMQAADLAVAHRRLAAGAAIGFSPGAAARRQGKVAPPVARRPHSSTGHEVGSRVSRVRGPIRFRRRAQCGEIERRRQAGPLEAVEVGLVDRHRTKYNFFWLDWSSDLAPKVGVGLADSESVELTHRVRMTPRHALSSMEYSSLRPWHGDCVLLRTPANRTPPGERNHGHSGCWVWPVAAAHHRIGWDIGAHGLCLVDQRYRADHHPGHRAGG